MMIGVQIALTRAHYSHSTLRCGTATEQAYIKHCRRPGSLQPTEPGSLGPCEQRKVDLRKIGANRAIQATDRLDLNMCDVRRNGTCSQGIIVSNS